MAGGEGAEEEVDGVEEDGAGEDRVPSRRPSTRPGEEGGGEPPLQQRLQDGQ